ncbi:hypothetical protein EAG_01979, partial [Camponotus floridanus]
PISLLPNISKVFEMII